MVERLESLGTPEESAGYSEFTDAADELAQATSDARLAAERGEEGGLEEAQSDVDSALVVLPGSGQHLRLRGLLGSPQRALAAERRRR